MSSSTKTKFSPPPLAPSVPVPEYLLRVATAYSDREVVYHLQDSDDQGLLTSITWRQFLADVWSRVDHLLEVTRLKPRAIGSEHVVVGLLAESNYHFLLDLVAMFILRWQVRPPLSRASKVSFSSLFHPS